jgi:hypothetical protein
MSLWPVLKETGAALRKNAAVALGRFIPQAGGVRRDRIDLLRDIALMTLPASDETGVPRSVGIHLGRREAR